MQKKLTKIHFFILSCLSVIFLFTLTWNLDRSLKEKHDKEIIEVFKSELHSLEKSFTSKKDQLIQHATYVSKNKELKSIIEKFHQKKYSWKEVNNAVKPFLKNQIDNFRYMGYFIISKDGLSLASSRDSNVGTESLLFKNKEIWNKVLRDKPFITPIIQSDVELISESSNKLATMFVMTPIKKGSLTLGYLAFRIDPNLFYWEQLLSVRIGETRESYLVSREGDLLSPSRFQSQLTDYLADYLPGKEIFNISLPVISEGKSPLRDMSHALSGFRLSPYPDYRGAAVVGIWQWIDSLNIGLVIERDYVDAYSNYQYSQKILWFIFLFSAGLISGIFYLLARFHERYKESLEVMTDHLSGIEATVLNYLPMENYRIQSTNQHFLQQTGLEKTQIIGRSILDFIHPDDLENFTKTIVHNLIDKNSIEHEYRMVFKDKTIHVKERGQIKQASGVVNIDSFITNITERKIMEKRLVNQITLSSIFQTLLRKASTFESTIEMYQFVLELLIDYHIAEINSGSVYSIDTQKDIHIEFEQGEVPEEIEGFFSRWEDSIRLKSQITNNLPVIEFIDDNKQEVYIPIELRGRVFGMMKLNMDYMKEFDGQVVQFLMSMAHIMSEVVLRLKIDEELALQRENNVKNERLSAVGEISDSLAHELNNPLMIIKGMIKLMKRSIEKEKYERLPKTIKDIDKATDRITTLVSSLRLFNRNHHTVIDQIDFRKFFNSMVIEGSIQAEKNDILLTYENQLDGCLFASKEELGFVIQKYITECCNVVRTQEEKEIVVTTKQINDCIELRIINMHAPSPEEIMQNKDDDQVVENKVEGVNLWKNIIELNKGSVEYINGHYEHGFVLRLMFEESLPDKKSA